MRIPRVFHPEPLAVEQTVVLSPDAVNHLVNVLRLKADHPIVLFNGDGSEYPATLTEVAKRKATARIDSRIGMDVESPLSIHLGQGISKGDRMDFVLQKSVELGVTEITPLITERCTVKLNAERWQKKQDQWQKIIIGACEQCGRNTLPKLHPVVDLSDWLGQSTNQTRLLLNPEASRPFNALKPDKAGVRLLIGPEGGLNDQEIYRAQEYGFNSVLLGPRVLRTETAALTSLAILQNLYGDLG
ncbi:16S rRNA (uracil(1498)-N(3))-methyltransferase [Saliniradius amylolyticus]|uniref:Ribosomal RNA small subunit methyltransferase E n=1 Tax=Saliniradius amylolyticus TaxID=2183582 RepID=A0A2S2E5C7_9ALTE|nr:16S rRNA (uracil(1498)-N(3))-methyltransferase [Saliniradius amylolyticus]AWL12861.1 16S rRNA (uracil(1498)-N(3))-methyltransferase [Saliniradius amylolyticus]